MSGVNMSPSLLYTLLNNKFHDGPIGIPALSKGLYKENYRRAKASAITFIRYLLRG